MNFIGENIIPEKARAVVLAGEEFFGNTLIFKKLAPIIERTFLPFLGGENVVLHIPDGKYYVPSPDDRRIWILVWSTPKERDQNQMLGTPTVLGHPTQSPLKAFPTIAAQGQRIDFEPRGPAIAQIFDRRIYILANITEQPFPIMDQIFEAILYRALEIFINESKVFPESLYDAVKSNPEHDIIAAMMFSEMARMRDLEFEIDKNRTEAIVIEGQLAKGNHNIFRSCYNVANEERLYLWSKQVEAKNRELSEIPPCPAKIIEQIQADFEFIVTHPLIRYLPHSHDSTLTIYTRQILTRHRANGNLHEIGFFRMVVPIEIPSDFRWFNLSRRVHGLTNDMCHPHVYGEGHGCLGNARDVLSRVMEQGDLYGTVTLGLRFLKSCNIADTAGKHLTRWPISEFD